MTTKTAVKDGRQKYDWESLKAQYIVSDMDDVEAFMRSIFGQDWVRSGNVNQHTSGWAEEKKEMKRRILKAVMAEHEKTMTHKLLECKKSIIEITHIKLTHYSDAGLMKAVKMHPKELEILWKITRTELGEPMEVPSTQKTQDELFADLMQEYENPTSPTGRSSARAKRPKVIDEPAAA